MKKPIPIFLFAFIIGVAGSCSGAFTLSEINPTQQTQVQNAVAMVDASSMLQVLQDIESSRLSKTACRDEAVALFQAAGLTAAIDVAQGNENIIAELPGAEPFLNPVIVQAHWDIIDAPGMDDDGSGMAGVIETARVLAASGLQFRRTVRFILYDNEELGLLGSKAYADGLSSASLPCFFLNYDMIGCTSAEPDSLCPVARQAAGDYIIVMAPEWAAEAVAEFARDARMFAPALRFFASTLPGEYKTSPLLSEATRGDHESFWDRSAHGLLLATADRNPHYHTTGDTLDTLDIDFLTLVVKAGLAAVCVRAEMR